MAYPERCQEYGKLVSRLPRLSEESHGQTRVAVFLATPSLAGWFQEDHPFLQEAMLHMYEGLSNNSGNEEREFRSVSVIVDRLPGPSFCKATSPADGRPTKGSEGIGLLLQSIDMRHTDAIGQEGRTDYQPVVQFRAKAELNQHGTVSSVKFIEMPVANTFFVNGMRSTMYEDTWRIGHSGPPTFHHVVRRPLQQVQICTGVFFTGGILHIPLQTLTEPRKILASMGNVLREIGGDEGNPQPASAELEIRLPNFLKEHASAVEDSKYSVYALIGSKACFEAFGEKSLHVTMPTTPPKYVDLSQVKQSGKTPASTSIDFKNMLFDGGAHLHRVTSGGGGWGNKQGLLSLDAARDFGMSDDHETTYFEPDATKGGEASLSPITEGDMIQFFACLYSAKEATEGLNSHGQEHESSEVQKDPISDQGQIFCLGVIPPQEDFTGHKRQDFGGLFNFFPNHFGMLSENRASVGVDTTQTGLARTGLAASAKKRSTGSRMDVPFASFVVRR